MLKVVRYQLSHLTDVSGRDARPTFWWFVLILVLVQFMLSFLVSIPMMGSMVSGAMDAAQAGADEQAMQAGMLSEMGVWLGRTMWFSIGINILLTLLLLAAFVRRLHDIGWSGYWALLPVATLAVSSWMGVETIGRLEALLANISSVEDMAQLQAAAMDGNYGGLIGWAGLIFAAVLGALKSQDGPNQYGEVPLPLKP